ncbi:MAG TPA: extracellular solute-binding protein [Candidatus Acidoferrales bacterium]|nr:extracellular solute-binding protein [Candidatus Acidoferrales bacterium]
MERKRLRQALLLPILAALVSSPAAAQTKDKGLTPTKDEILARAKQEGKLALVPGYDKGTIAPLAAAFTRKYPFIEVSWEFVTGITGAQRQLFEMTAGRSNIDVFSPSTVHWSEYFKHNLIKRYDFRALSTSGQLKIPVEMLDESGIVAWFGTNTGVFVYNTQWVPPEKAPRGWDSCIEPQWKGKLAVDTKPNTLAWLVPAWGEEKVFDFARKLKKNDPIWVRGQTGTLARMAAGEVALDCGMYFHTSRRYLMKDPTAPIKVVIPNPVPVSFHEPEAIYVGAKNPHAGLLWMEFVASREAQEIVDKFDPGKASFLVEGTLAHSWLKNVKVSLCAGACRNQEERLIERIAVEAWGLPKAGSPPK